MKCLLVLISLLSLVSNAPQRDEKQQKRTMIVPHLVSPVTLAELKMGQSISHELDSLLNPGLLKDGSGWQSMVGSGGLSPGFTIAPSIQNPKLPVQQNIDVVLVLDSSGSVGSTAFGQAKTAAKTIVKYIHNKAPISVTGSRIALIEFSSTALTNVAFHLNSYNTHWNVLNAIDSVMYDSGPATATAKALREAKAEIDRNGIFANANLVWIITDGMSNEDGNPVPVAKQLKDAGIKICATGVGSRINHAEIDAIASPNCTYYPTSFSSYVKAVEVAYLKGNGTLGAEFFKGIQEGKIFGR